jgi:hypothetical protein
VQSVVDVTTPGLRIVRRYPMTRAALVFPVVPGKDARDIAREMKSRPREYEQSRKRLGITMERAYLQHTPMGDYVVTYIENEGDIVKKFGEIASSDLDLDRYFTKAVKEIHGVDLAQPMPGPAPETVAVWTDAAVERRGRGFAFCAPLIPGQTETARAFVADAYHRDEFAASRRRLHVSEELITLQSTPQGDIVGVYIEGDDPEEGNRGFAASQEPFDLWFKEQLATIFPPAIDFTKPVEGIEETFDSTKVADLRLKKAA